MLFWTHSAYWMSWYSGAMSQTALFAILPGRKLSRDESVWYHMCSHFVRWCARWFGIKMSFSTKFVIGMISRSSTSWFISVKFVFFFISFVLDHQFVVCRFLFFGFSIAIMKHCHVPYTIATRTRHGLVKWVEERYRDACTRPNGVLLRLC